MPAAIISSIRVKPLARAGATLSDEPEVVWLARSTETSRITEALTNQVSRRPDGSRGCRREATFSLRVSVEEPYVVCFDSHMRQRWERLLLNSVT
jgi:hypothetical protein